MIHVAVASFLGQNAHKYLVARLTHLTRDMGVTVDDYGRCEDFLDAINRPGRVPDVVFIGGGEPDSLLDPDRLRIVRSIALYCEAVSVPRSVYSCLAAQLYATVHFGVNVSRRTTKFFGVFGHGDGNLLIAHSRWNIVHWNSEGSGFSPKYPCDSNGEPLLWTSIGDDDSQVVLLQGHPEYATNMLIREYRRDVARDGATAEAPIIPMLTDDRNPCSPQNLAAVDRMLESTARHLIETIMFTPRYERRWRNDRLVMGLLDDGQ